MSEETLQTIVKWVLCVIYTTLVILANICKWLYSSLSYWRVKPRPVPPKSLTDLPFEATHKYLTVNGVKLHCVCAGDESKKLMLFVHGFPEFWYSWRHQMKYFLDNYWVVAYDMRGYGDSDKPANVEDYDIPKLVGDLEGLVRALGRKKVDVLVAHDWGGVVCWVAMFELPKLADKFIAINIPHPSVFMKAIQSSWKQFFMSWYTFFFQMPYVPEFLLRCNDLSLMNDAFQGSSGEWKDRVTEEEIEAYKYTYAKPGAFTGPINYYRANMGKRKDDRPKEEQIVKAPTLVIWGNADVALSEPMAHDCKEFVKDFTLKIVEGAPHFVPTTHPDIVNKHMSEWLEAKM